MNQGLIPNMNKLFVVAVIIGLAVFCSCQKPQSDEERNAEIEQQVQQRLTAERQAKAEEELAKQKSELEARDAALAQKEQATVNVPVAENSQTPLRAPGRDTSEDSPTASYSTFYTGLEPYGVWRETSTYGYVFQPREAERSRSWRPYTHGRWVYTDVGWTWVSEEPFGWATYHYGRWARLRNIGWVWVPGEEWAPAWVSWRKSNDYVGWAPLPPEARFDRSSGIHNWADNYYDIGPEQYCFVTTNQFGGRRLETAVVPSERNVIIVNETTNVTDITYNNTIIVNQGPSYDELRARTQQPIERLRLERESTVNVQTENPRSVIKGAVIQVPAPVIAKAQPAERPRSVKEKIAQTTVEHGWEGIADRQAAEKARAKIKSESTRPPDAAQKTFVKPAQPSAESSPSIPSPSAIRPAVSPTQAARPTAASKPIAPVASPTLPPRAITASPAAVVRSPVPRSTVSPSATPRPRQTPLPLVTATARPHGTTGTTSPALSPTRGSARQRGPVPDRALQKAEKPGAQASPDVGASGTPMTSASPTKAPETENKKKKKQDRNQFGDRERD
jgi:hypothetical protein